MADKDHKKHATDVSPDLVNALMLVAATGKGSRGGCERGFTDGVVLAGSAGSKLFPFFSDVDGIQTVDFSSVLDIANALQRVVRRLRDTPNFCFVELKAGLNEDGVVLPERCWIEGGAVRRWDGAFTQSRMTKAHSLGLVSERDFDWYRRLLPGPLSPREFVRFEERVDPWKVRWSATEVLDGKRKSKGPVLSLHDAIGMNALIKLDALFWSSSEQRYLELSMIYVFTCKGRPVNAFYTDCAPPPVLSLKQGAFACFVLHDYVKLAKRLLSLAVAEGGRAEDVHLLRSIIVSDTGRAAVLAGDCATLEEALDEFHPVPPSKVHAEVAGIKARATRLYGLTQHAKTEIERACMAVAAAPLTRAGMQTMHSALAYIHGEVATFSYAGAHVKLETHGYLPLPEWAAP